MKNYKVITDFNEHTLEELVVINQGLSLELIINDGKIVGVTDGRGARK